MKTAKAAPHGGNMGRVNSERLFKIQEGELSNGPVVYWMFREQRLNDNWALIHAQDEALRRGVPLEIVFCLIPGFLGAGLRQYRFMFDGLKQVERQSCELDIPFKVICGDPGEAVAEYVAGRNCSYLVVDFFPLRIFQSWVKGLCKKVNGTIMEVDAHNIVPCRVCSPKQEYAARTIRPKIHKRLAEFLEDFPKLSRHSFESPAQGETNDWGKLENCVNPDPEVQPVNWIVSGSAAANAALELFLATVLKIYDKGRNDPNLSAQSDLSPYLHFGQLSAQRVAFEAARAKNAGEANVAAFIEELVIRRELTDNFCFYNPHYDSLNGIADWAYRTLDEHLDDERAYVYDLQTFENAETHSDLWNAAQTQMLKTGKMHGYMRMFWAKKILEWSASPEKAVEIAIYLNDRYSLDGRDPNGYVGVLWSIGGVHDRGWTERKVYGKIRYMNERGCRRKFSVDKYISTWLGMRPAI